MTLNATRYTLHFTATTPVRLPDYAGSSLRGAFGASLRQLACMTRAKTCDGCPVAMGCTYAQVFEPSLIAVTLQPLYLIEPPPRGLPVLFEGEALTFRMTLFGQAHHHLALLILVWQRAFARGLGRNDDGSPNSTAALDAVLLDELPDGTQRVIYEAGGLVKPHTQTLPDAPSAPEACTLIFHTPLRISDHGRIRGKDEIHPARLIMGIARRACELGLCPEPDWQALQTACEKLSHTVEMHWREWARRSSRQQQVMPMGGWVGRVMLSAEADSDLSAVWQWLWYGQWLHVGKNTVFGLGRYTMEYEA